MRRRRKATDQTIGFAVSLSRAASGAVTVEYATADGTATAGEDYSSASGTLTFAAGETAKTVSVPVLDDVIDEGQETFTLRLSNATGARIADAEATGTVSNGDPLQKMWLSRFGRTVADHVVDAVAGRLSAPRAGAQITLAGQSVDLSRTGDSAVLVDAMTGLARAFGAPGGAAPSGVTAPGAWAGPARRRLGQPGRQRRLACPLRDGPRAAARELVPPGLGRRGRRRRHGPYGLGPGDGGRFRRPG